MRCFVHLVEKQQQCEHLINVVNRHVCMLLNLSFYEKIEELVNLVKHSGGNYCKKVRFVYN